MSKFSNKFVLFGKPNPIPGLFAGIFGDARHSGLDPESSQLKLHGSRIKSGMTAASITVITVVSIASVLAVAVFVILRVILPALADDGVVSPAYVSPAGGDRITVTCDGCLSDYSTGTGIVFDGTQSVNSGVEAQTLASITADFEFDPDNITSENSFLFGTGTGANNVATRGIAFFANSVNQHIYIQYGILAANVIDTGLTTDVGRIQLSFVTEGLAAGLNKTFEISQNGTVLFSHTFTNAVTASPMIQSKYIQLGGFSPSSASTNITNLFRGTLYGFSISTSAGVQMNLVPVAEGDTAVGASNPAEHNGFYNTVSGAYIYSNSASDFGIAPSKMSEVPDNFKVLIGDYWEDFGSGDQPIHDGYGLCTNIEFIDINTLECDTPARAEGVVSIGYWDTDTYRTPFRAENAFTYGSAPTPSPEATAITPNHGPTTGNTNAIITGSGFASITTPPPFTATQIAVGSSSAFAIDTNGEIWAWGSNSASHLGNNNSCPIPYSSDEEAELAITQALEGSGYEDLEDYLMSEYGYDNLEDLVAGEGFASIIEFVVDWMYGGTSPCATPINISAISGSPLNGKNIIQISVSPSGNAVLALDDNHHVYAWGLNGSGNLGTGDTVAHTTPVEITANFVMSGRATTIDKVVMGQNEAYAIASNGHVYAWGNNASGQLGKGTATSGAAANYLPVDISTVSGSSINGKTITNIASSSNSVIALDSAGHVHTWGNNQRGQLGKGNNTTATANYKPVDISLLSNPLNGVTITHVYTNSVSSMITMVAISSAGDVYTWGQNSQGTLGKGTMTSGSTEDYSPVNISTLSNAINGQDVSIVRIGGDSAIALGADGSLYGWGVCSAGTFALEPNCSLLPAPPIAIGTALPDGVDIVDLGIMHRSAYFLSDTGVIYAVGENNLGNLGIGTLSGNFAEPQIVGESIVTITSVTFDGIEAEFTVDSDNGISVIVPPHAAGNVSVILTDSNGVEYEVPGGYTYETTLEIYDIDPPYGPTAGGNIVTVTGSGFQQIDYPTLRSPALRTAPSGATEISTCQDFLSETNNDPSGTFSVVNDLDCSSAPNWGYGYLAYKFSGQFYGNGHTISNITSNDFSGGDDADGGLFTYLNGGAIYDLNIANITMNAGDSGANVGAVVGYLTSGTISNVKVLSGSIGGDSSVGGIVGNMEDGTIEYVENHADVSDDENNVSGVGGIVGFMSSGGQVTKSANYGAVSGYNSVGGIIGMIAGDDAPPSDLFNQGAITGYGSSYENVAGIVGTDHTSLAVERAYNAGSLTPGDRGAIALDTAGGQNVSSYWNTDLMPNARPNDEGGDTGKTTAEMKTQSTYVGWDFDTVWQMFETPEVLIDGQPCEVISVISDTQLTCRIPGPHAAGTVDATVSVGGQTATLTGGYTYEELYIALSADKVTAVMNPSPTANAGEAFDSVDLMTSTNFQNGYRLSISATEPALVCASGPRIEPLSATGSLAVDKWGYGVGSVSAASGVWKGVTTSPVQFDMFGSAVELPAHRDTYLWFGTKVNSVTPACVYETEVTILAQGDV